MDKLQIFEEGFTEDTKYHLNGAEISSEKLINSNDKILDVYTLDQLEQTIGLGGNGWWLDSARVEHPYDPDESDGIFPTEAQKQELSKWLREPFEKHPQIAPYSTLLVDKINTFITSNYSNVVVNGSFELSPNISQDFSKINSPLARKGTIIIDKNSQNLYLEPLLTQNISKYSRKSPVAPSQQMMSPYSSPKIGRKCLTRRDTFAMDKSGDFNLNIRPAISIGSLAESICEEDWDSFGDVSNAYNNPPLSAGIKQPPKQSDMPQFSRGYLKSTSSQGALNNSLEYTYKINQSVRGSQESVNDLARQEEMALRSSVDNRYSRSPSNRNLYSTSNPDLSIKLSNSYDLSYSQDLCVNPKRNLKGSYDIISKNNGFLNESYTIDHNRPVNKSYDLIDPTVLAKQQEKELRDSCRNRRNVSGNSGSSRCSSNHDIAKTDKITTDNSFEDLARSQERALRECIGSYSRGRTHKRNEASFYNDNNSSVDRKYSYIRSSLNNQSIGMSNSLHESPDNISISNSLSDFDNIAKLQEASLKESMKKYQLTKDSKESLNLNVRNSFNELIDNGIKLRQSFDQMPKLKPETSNLFKPRPNIPGRGGIPRPSNLPRPSYGLPTPTTSKSRFLSPNSASYTQRRK